MELEQIRGTIQSFELVDGHAHNLVSTDSKMLLSQALSEAEGDALTRFASETLCFKRSVRDLASLYGVDPSLQSIESHRREAGLESVTEKCFREARIGVVLIDDGLKLDRMKPLEWHQKFVPAVSRVLRIEAVAEEILNEARPSGVTWTLDSFAERFINSLKSLSKEAVAFKSIAAYRSGLDINPNVSNRDAEEGLMEDIAKTPLRISNKALVSFIFLRGLEVACLNDLPMQIHSGFGDKDLDLRLANPLHLRAVLEDERFAKCRLVLLHASYPFVQEASYLASVYTQIYLDFGLAIPKLSIRGMENTLSQLLELAPVSKVMFSSDGVGFPETYYLGAKWSREVLAKVLHNAYVDGDLSVKECISAAERILRGNALSFYKLDQTPTSVTSAAELKKKQYTSDEVKVTGKGVKHVRLLWCDAAGMRRCRVVPVDRFKHSVVESGVGLVECCMAFPAGMDAIADGSGLTSVGEVRLVPDLTTLHQLPWNPQHAIVLGEMHSAPGTSWGLCPRGTLKRVLHILKQEFNLEVRAGFENEFYLLKEDPAGWKSIDASKYCSATAFDGVSEIMDDLYESLKLLDIDVEQMHAEAGQGQFELVLTHYPAVVSADNVLLLRETVKSIAAKHHLQATFLPKFYPADLGSGSHVHLSIWEGDVNKLTAEPDEKTSTGMSSLGENFLAGVLHHLPSILVFTAPHPNSYERLVPNTWSGAFQCWGHSNKEATLRTLGAPGTTSVSNFELKAFDGMANPHLGLAAIVAAGMDGLRNHLVLPKGIDTNPASLPEGTVPRLPVNLTESVKALQADNSLKSILGEKLVQVVCAVRLMDVDIVNTSADSNHLLGQLMYSF